MSGFKLAAIALIVAGTLGLVYGQFTYPKSEDHTKMGPITISVRDEKTVNIPTWAGVAGIAAGALMLLAGKRGARL